MTVNELRIRNLLRVSDEILEVTAIITTDTSQGFELYGKISGKEVDYDYAIYAEPIPLTEEWLLKFGFVKDEGFDLGISLTKVPKYILGDFQILVSSNVFHYVRWGYDGGTGEELESVVEIQYVHQIQNLYFALTGKELTIKELSIS